jgi:hypothetical protein
MTPEGVPIMGTLFIEFFLINYYTKFAILLPVPMNFPHKPSRRAGLFIRLLHGLWSQKGGINSIINFLNH